MLPSQSDGNTEFRVPEHVFSTGYFVVLHTNYAIKLPYVLAFKGNIHPEVKFFDFKEFYFKCFLTTIPRQLPHFSHQIRSGVFLVWHQKALGHMTSRTEDDLISTNQT